MRVANLYHRPIITVARRVAVPAADSIVITYAKWVDRLTKPSLPSQAAAAPAATPDAPAPAGTPPPRNVADEMATFADQAVSEASRTLKLELDYSEASLGLLDHEFLDARPVDMGDGERSSRAGSSTGSTRRFSERAPIGRACGRRSRTTPRSPRRSWPRRSPPCSRLPRSGTSSSTSHRTA